MRTLSSQKLTRRVPSLSEEVLSVFKHLFPDRVNLHEPVFNGNEWAYVKECLDTRWVSSGGKFVDRFEIMLAEYAGVKRAVAVVNGTAALHISLKMSGVEAGDEVLVPDLTFVAVANAVAYCGAIPHFVDSEEKTLGVDSRKLKNWLEKAAKCKNGECFNKKTGRRIRAVVAVHTFGHPVDLEPLADVCRSFYLQLIEDGAEALGSLYKGQHIGHWGELTALSFNGNKTITTGGGGAVLTNDEKLAQQMKHLTTTAKTSHRWKFDHDEVGYNYRLPNLNAALGCAQLEQLPDFLNRKRALASRYREVFSGVKGIRFFTEPEFAKSNYWLNVLLLDPEHSSELDQLLTVTNDHGFMTRPAWTLMHKLPMYRRNPRMDISTAESIESRLINIPSSAFLSAFAEDPGLAPRMSAKKRCGFVRTDSPERCGENASSASADSTPHNSLRRTDPPKFAQRRTKEDQTQGTSGLPEGLHE